MKLKYLFVKILISLDLSSIDTVNAINFEYMFSQAINLDILNISSFIINEDAFYEGIFEGCNNSNLTIIINNNTFKNKSFLENIEQIYSIEYINAL